MLIHNIAPFQFTYYSNYNRILCDIKKVIFKIQRNNKRHSHYVYMPMTADKNIMINLSSVSVFSTSY